MWFYRRMQQGSLQENGNRNNTQNQEKTAKITWTHDEEEGLNPNGTYWGQER